MVQRRKTSRIQQKPFALTGFSPKPVWLSDLVSVNTGRRRRRGATALFPHFSFANSSRHSLANVANFLHPLVTVWLPNSILFENTNTKLKDCVI